MIKKILLLFAFITSTLSSFAQNTQCDNLDITSSTASCLITTTELSAHFLNPEYRDTDTYIINDEPSCLPDVTGTTNTNIVIDDDWNASPISLGFTFCFYGNQYDQIIVSDNGKVSFDLDMAGEDDNNWNLNVGDQLPNVQWQPNTIFAPFFDSNSNRLPVAQRAGAISFKIFNQDQSIPENVGNRVFMISFDSPSFGSCDVEDSMLKSTILLYETSNVIDVEIRQKNVCTDWNQGRALIGIQNKSATRGMSPPGRGQIQDGVEWDPRRTGYPGDMTIDRPDGELWRFIPDGDLLDYQFKWYADYGNGFEALFPNRLVDPDVIYVNSLDTVDYKATLSYQAECSYSEVIIEEFITITQPAGSPNVGIPENLVACEISTTNPTAVFDIDQTAFLMQDFTAAELAMFEAIYYYFEDQDTPVDGIAEVHIIDQADLATFVSETGRQIFILLQVDCSGDFDGDGVLNCEDPDPQAACDSNDATLDCDGDGMLNGVDPDPLVPEVIPCDTNDCSLDCDNDGILNCVDANPNSCDTNDCSLDCDADGIPNCIDVDPLVPYVGACSAVRSFTLTVLPLDDSSFTYPNAVVCKSDASNPTPVLPLATTGGTFTIEPMIAGDPAGIINTSTGEVDLVLTPAGSYTITYTTATPTLPAVGCPTSSTFTLTINTITVDVLNNQEDCDSYTLPTLTIGNYFTETGGTGTTLSAGDIITATQTIYIYGETGTTPNCTDESSFTFTLYNTPVAGIPTQLNECDNGDGTANFDLINIEDEIVANQAVTITYHNTQADAEAGIDTINTNPIARVTGNIWARIENTDGCFDVIEVPLVVDQCFVIIPSGFSPNSSVSENQTFTINNIKTMFPKYTLYIYNRYGQEVFSGDANKEDWNGKKDNDGDFLPAGTYFYGLKLNDEQDISFRGWVYLQL